MHNYTKNEECHEESQTYLNFLLILNVRRVQTQLITNYDRPQQTATTAPFDQRSVREPSNIIYHQPHFGGVNVIV